MDNQDVESLWLHIIKNMRLIVCGGGIAGLFCARELLQHGHKVVLLEAANRLGGRIKTHEMDGMAFECGAGRFASSHTNLLNLLRHYHLDNKMIELGSGRTFVKDGKKTAIDPDAYMARFLDTPKSKLQGKTLEVVMHENGVPPSLIEDIKSAYAYPHEFELSDAHTSLMTFKNDMNESIRYFVLMGGLGQLIDALQADLLSQGCDIITSALVTGYKNGRVEYRHTSKGTHRVLDCDHVFWCLTKNALLGVKGMEINTTLTKSFANLQEVPLARVYARFPLNENGQVWFNGIGRVTTNNLIRHFIPINEAAGLVMASYTDGRFAMCWERFHENKNKKHLEEMLMASLRQVFPNMEIPKPKWLHFCVSSPGVHVWEPNALKYSNSSSLLAAHGYMVCGEMVAPYGQGWIEAALKSAKKALRDYGKWTET
jgi:hypothetical protein